MKQEWKLPGINRYGEVVMSLIHKPVLLIGSKGRVEVDALFDSGASYSCINYSLAEKIAHLEPLVEPMEFETAEKDSIIRAEYHILIEFHFLDTERRFTDEIIVLDNLSEEAELSFACGQKAQLASHLPS